MFAYWAVGNLFEGNQDHMTQLVTTNGLWELWVSQSLLQKANRDTQNQWAHKETDLSKHLRAD